MKDPATADLLCPRDVIGGKRLCVGTGYYETYNNPSVHLVDASGGIEAITPSGIYSSGKEYAVDCIVYATGYDAFTGSLHRIDIRGRQGLALRDKWAAGPVTYLGMATTDFPNFFCITGPGSPSVLTNMVPSIEQHVDWIADCISHVVNTKTNSCIEAHAASEQAWTEHVNVIGRQTLRSGVDSWYLGANVPGKPRVFMPYTGGFPAYARKCEEVAAKGYEGFRIS